MQQKIWTHKETEALKELLNTVPPTPTSKIAAALGRTSDSVRHKVKWMRTHPETEYVEKPVPVKKVAKKPVVKKAVKAATPPKTVKKGNGPHISYAPLEWCPVCRAAVSNWTDHINRMGWYGCKMPAA